MLSPILLHSCSSAHSYEDFCLTTLLCFAKIAKDLHNAKANGQCTVCAHDLSGTSDTWHLTFLKSNLPLTSKMPQHTGHSSVTFSVFSSSWLLNVGVPEDSALDSLLIYTNFNSLHYLI